MTLATVRPSDDDRDKAFTETQNILKVLPDVKLIMDISAPAVPGSAEAVLQSGRHNVDVIGLSLPTICKPYIHGGSVQSIILWNTRNLGYLTVYAGWLDAQHKIDEFGDFTFSRPSGQAFCARQRNRPGHAAHHQQGKH